MSTEAIRSSQDDLSYRKIFHFWLPLALTWAMMAIEGPVLNSVVSRLASQRDNLAAYGLAAGIAMIIESPIIMMLSATVALVRDKQSLQFMQRYGNRLNILVTVGMLIVIIPQVHSVLAYDILQLTPEIADLLHLGLMCLVPWPAAIGYRRFYQGLMIKNGKTRLVAIGSIARITTMFVSALLLALYSSLPGVMVGCVALSSAVLLEAIATRWLASEAVSSFKKIVSAEDFTLSTSKVNTFYIPLALTSVLGMAINPLLAFFMSRFPLMLESLAVFPVVDSFVFQFRSPGFSYQEIGIALLDDSMNKARKIRNFGFMLMLITSSLLALVSFSPLLMGIYSIFPYQLAPDLAHFAVLPTQILVLLPALSVLYSLQRAVLINKHQTTQVTYSTLVEVACIFLVLILEWKFCSFAGAVAVCIALVLGRIVANLYLSVAYRRALRIKS